MSIHNFAMSSVAGSSAQGGDFYPYLIDQSLRFDRNSSSYLTRTPSSAGNRKTFTLSFWYKNCDNTNDQIIWGSRIGSNDQFQLHKNTSGGLDFYNQTGGAITVRMITSSVFRDVSAWYHIVLKIDVTTGTSANAIYVNGVEQPLTTDTSSNTNTYVNSTVPHQIGRWDTGGYINAYMAEVHFIDGTALDATSFGETKEGVWVPKEYDTADGAYGTNGFYLSFADSGAIGDDLSGNTNDFTANNLAASDVVLDSPTNSFCTMNILDDNFSTPIFTYFEGNLKYTYSYTGTGFDRVFGTHMIEPGDTNKYYMEFTGNVSASNEQLQWGIVATDSTTYSPSNRTVGITAASDINSLRWAKYTAAPHLRRIDGDGDNALSTTNGNASNGDIFSIVYDAGAGKTFAWLNGVEVSGQDYSAGTSLWTTLDTTKTYAVMMYAGDGGGTSKNGNMTANFGQDSSFAGAKTAQGNADANGIGDFYYAVPTGAVALCSANLPEATIGPNSTTQADDYFNTVLYSGNSSTQSITGVGFQPDWVWTKIRSSANNHYLLDSVRGGFNRLNSNSTNIEVSSSDAISSFDSDGYTIAGAQNEMNLSGSTYVSWNWKAGGTAVSNTDGSITSSVSANQDAGFSIVSYTGTGANATIGHGLSSAPEMIIIKARTRAENWVVYHKFDGGTDGRSFLNLNTSGARFDNGPGSYFQDTPPTSSVFYQNGSTYNVNTDTYIAYCFHSVEGYSKLGSMELNNNADGTFVYLGFRPALVIAKRSDGAYDWAMFDNTRDAFNDGDLDLLQPSTNFGESSFAASPIDLLSNGFKLRHNSSNGYLNTTTDTAIYYAVADQPFKYSNAR